MSSSFHQGSDIHKVAYLSYSKLCNVTTPDGKITNALVLVSLLLPVVFWMLGYNSS